jgi:hypothetical protein
VLLEQISRQQASLRIQDNAVSRGIHLELLRRVEFARRQKLARQVVEAAKRLLPPPRLTAAMLGGYSTDACGLNGIPIEPEGGDGET